MRKAAFLSLAAVLAAAAADAPKGTAPRPATQPSRPAGGLGGNLEYWLDRAAPAASQPATAASQGADPFRKSGPLRDDALPGVIELSDGTLLPGWLYTTRESPYLVFPRSEKRWRRVPLAAVLGVAAVVTQERMELQWRWKAMGEPEKVYTGRKYPFRRLQWRFHLVDDSQVVGDVKGQPLWVERDGETWGPFVLHERMKGEVGATLADLVYVKRVIVSRRLMEEVIRTEAAAKGDPQSLAPAGGDPAKAD